MENDGLGDFRTRRTVIATQFPKCIKKFDYSQFKLGAAGCWIPRSSRVHHVKEPRVAKTKNGFAPRVCERCGLPFEWRKKWEKNWDAVKYCSTKCRENK